MNNGNQIVQAVNAANVVASKQNSAYLPPISTFKKGPLRSGSIHEEPTLLSFFFLFHWDDPTASPLFGPAVSGTGAPQRTAFNYFEKTVSNTDPAYGGKKAAQLKSFINILKKVNTEMPWFWQTVTGLEVARTITEEEPWKAAEKPKIEIECLEENIELTATKLMDLYRNIVWDTKRHVRVLPTNVSRFTMDIYVTEVRAFQANTGSSLLGSYRGSTAYGIYTNEDPDNRNAGVPYAKGFTQENLTSMTVGETKPVFAIRLIGCEFDMNSGQEAFAELSKNPEVKKPKIGIFYKYAETLLAHGGPNLPLDTELKQNENAPGGAEGDARNPYDPMDDLPKVKQALAGIGKGIANKVGDAVNGALAQARNAMRLTNGGNSAIGNVYGSRFNGPLADAIVNFGGQALDSLIAEKGSDKIKNFRKLLLGNVYGIGDGMALRNVISLASANAIGAIPLFVSQAAQEKNKPVGDSDLSNVYDNTGGTPGEPPLESLNVYDLSSPGTLDTTPDGNLGGNVYDLTIGKVDQKENNPNKGLSPKNIYNGPAIDSSPDGNLNQNVYE